MPRRSRLRNTAATSGRSSGLAGLALDDAGQDQRLARAWPAAGRARGSPRPGRAPGPSPRVGAVEQRGAGGAALVGIGFRQHAALRRAPASSPVQRRRRGRAACAICAAVSPSGMVSWCCTGLARCAARPAPGAGWRAAGKSSSPAWSAPSPRVGERGQREAASALRDRRPRAASASATCVEPAARHDARRAAAGKRAGRVEVRAARRSRAPPPRASASRSSSGDAAGARIARRRLRRRA